MSDLHTSFGLPHAGAQRVTDAADGIGLLRSGKARADSLLAYGNGRSYGDTCLNASGTLIDMRSADTLLSFDAQAGLIEAEAGLMLSDIIAYAAPSGWFPAVVPGTRFVTLGGAIANDVHGKNHHRRGTFGKHVESLRLARSDGTVVECSRTENVDLFSATIGGMGLTGLILSAKLRLMRVGSLDVEERVTRFGSLEEYLEIAADADLENEYAVAWIDQLARGKRQGRGLLLTGNHAGEGRLDGTTSRSMLAVPFRSPVNVLSRPFLKLFNEAYFRGKSRRSGPGLSSWASFFFPLDGVRNWNRLYGPRGLLQHQSVVPDAEAHRALPLLFKAARDAGHGSFLTVLKRFGDVASPGMLSFPRPGYTLTLDFPNRGPRTMALMAELDRITVEAGGAVNPYKDARMSAAVFRASFPDWRRVEALRDLAFVSDFWRRTALALQAQDVPIREAAE